MKNIRLTLAALSLMLGSSVPALVAVGTASAAPTGNPNCQVLSVQDIATSNNTASVQFVLSDGCSNQTISLATYLMHNSTTPLSDQRLFDFTAQNYGPGAHTITNALDANCFYQEDFWIGNAPQKLETNGDYNNTAHIPYVLEGAIGGGKDCIPPVVTPPTPTPTPPAATPTPPAQVVTTAAQPTALVNTGPGDVAALFAVATLGGAIAYRTVVRKLALNR